MNVLPFSLVAFSKLKIHNLKKKNDHVFVQMTSCKNLTSFFPPRKTVLSRNNFNFSVRSLRAVALRFRLLVL